MLARAATRLCQTSKLSIVPKRGFNGVLYQFSPPKNKLSNGELAVMGVVFVAAILGPPVYIASNFQEYNGRAAARRAAAGGN